MNSAFPSRKMRDCELAHTFCFWKLFRIFTGKMTRGLSLRVVFSLLLQDTLLCQDDQENTDLLGSRSHSPPSAPRSMTFPDTRSPLTFIHLSTFHSPAWHLQTSLAAEKTAIDRNTHGVNDSSIPLLQVHDSLVILQPKKTLQPHPAAL